MRVVLETWLGLYFIRMRRSALVVMSFMQNGCTIGTSAMYEYAATTIAPMYLVPK